eukprot:1868118-Rhodomonas_salina.1
MDFTTYPPAGVTVTSSNFWEHTGPTGCVAIWRKSRGTLGATVLLLSVCSTRCCWLEARSAT